MHTFQEVAEALMEAYALGGLFNDAYQLSEEMPDAYGLSPSVACWSHMVDAFCRAGLYEEGIDVFEVQNGWSQAEPGSIDIYFIICPSFHPFLCFLAFFSFPTVILTIIRNLV